MYDFKCIYYEFAVDFILIGLGGLGVLISSHFWDTKKRHKGKMILGVFFVGHSKNDCLLKLPVRQVRLK